MEKHLIIHGHFYQPPRRNPWTGVLGRQPGASPADNWNERILNECYMPNTEADLDGEKVNNFELISHNVGATLSGWMAESNIDVYRKIISADKARQGAMALPYNHSILPLDSGFIRKLQVQWGIQHFEMNYGRKPSGMWLPECAVNSDVIGELIKGGIKFIYLSSSQAKEIKRIRGYQWYDVSDGSIELRRPYRVFAPEGHIDVFFSCQELAVDISFRKILDNPAAAADKIEKMFGHKRTEDLILSVVTDGETFGHHHKGAEMGLARLIKKELPERGIKSVMPHEFLNQKDPEWEARVKENSSWSCAHGVERWRDDCGCGAKDGGNLRWRKPLREAVDRLSRSVVDVFRDKGREFFSVPPEEASLNFGRVISNPGMLGDFHERFVKEEHKNSPRVNKSIELIHFTCYMLTSCAWFFDDLKRVEPVQNLSVALRAIELLRELWGVDMEEEFYGRLNKHEDVEYVWNKLVKSRVSKPESMAKDFMDIHLFTGIKKSHRGYWDMEIKENEGRKEVYMENIRSGEKNSFNM
ncbi:MAG: DUF3536 domain-containing protein [Elusimicrobiota bacterium]